MIKISPSEAFSESVIDQYRIKNGTDTILNCGTESKSICVKPWFEIGESLVKFRTAYLYL